MAADEALTASVDDFTHSPRSPIVDPDLRHPDR